MNDISKANAIEIITSIESAVSIGFGFAPTNK